MPKNSRNINMMTFLIRCSTTLTITTLFLGQLLLSPPPISATTDIPVLDSDGNPIESTSQYYIFPSAIGSGGLSLKLRPDQSQKPLTCPEFVYRIPFENDLGLPVKFIPTDPAQTIITLFTDLKISFVSPYLYCPAAWSLTSATATAGIYVSTGVDVNRNGDTMLNATFKIETTSQPYEYKVTYSPPPPEVALGFLALFYENSTDWLGLSFSAQPKALPVYFKKRN